MRDPVKPLARSVRMSDPDYPGVVRYVGSGWRLVVSLDGRRYRLQPRAVVGSGEVWPSPPALVAFSLSELVGKCAASVEGLAQACEGLPDDPAQANPELAVRYSALRSEVATNRARASLVQREARASFFREQSAKRAFQRSAGGRRRPDSVKVS